MLRKRVCSGAQAHSSHRSPRVVAVEEVDMSLRLDADYSRVPPSAAPKHILLAPRPPRTRQLSQWGMWPTTAVVQHLRYAISSARTAARGSRLDLPPCERAHSLTKTKVAPGGQQAHADSNTLYGIALKARQNVASRIRQGTPVCAMIPQSTL